MCVMKNDKRRYTKYTHTGCSQKKRENKEKQTNYKYPSFQVLIIIYTGFKIELESNICFYIKYRSSRL